MATYYKTHAMRIPGTHSYLQQIKKKKNETKNQNTELEQNHKIPPMSFENVNTWQFPNRKFI